MAVLALAVDRALEPLVHIGAMSRKAAQLKLLQDRIGYSFTDQQLLERALTHVSALHANKREASYQRLEFLGDRVLGLAISALVYRTFPEADEGDLSRRLAALVRKETCAEIAAAMDLGSAIRVGPSEAAAKAGGQTILADACEAVIGAVYLDGGYEEASQLVERFWAPHLLRPPQPLRDAKTELQEWAQAKGLTPPAYRELDRTGPDHRPKFRVSVELPDLAPAEGVGPSKRVAEQQAAESLLLREGLRPGVADG